MVQLLVDLKVCRHGVSQQQNPQSTCTQHYLCE